MVFKKQNYHSVYEYPKETAALSPAMSERTMWKNLSYLMLDESAVDEENPSEFNSLDGFSISSSTRPFHSSQFNVYAQCHTWPNDSDFSWSQVQVNDLS